MEYALIVALAAGLITFVSMLAVNNPSDGATTQGMADYGWERQGCLGGCLMFPIILIVRPFEFLASAFGTATGAKDEAARKAVKSSAITSLVVGIIFGVLFYFFAL